MNYLVIKNNDVRKSYLCTNTCNKPRLKISNSYIPITSKNKTGTYIKASNSYLAEYTSTTSINGEKTITTGTTYLTRSSTSYTSYQTRSSSYYTTTSTSASTVTKYSGYVSEYGDHTDSTRGDKATGAPGSYSTYTSIKSEYYGSTYTSYIRHTRGTYVAGVSDGYYWYYTSVQNQKYMHSTMTTSASRSTSSTIRSTSNTIYLTRSSTSGTSYGTTTSGQETTITYFE